MQRIAKVTQAAALVLLAACNTGFRAGPVGLVNGASGDFGETRSSGLTLGATGEVALMLVSVTGEVAWTRFSATDATGPDAEVVEFWEITTGARFFIGPIMMGGQVGYLTNDQISGDEIIRPEIGLRLGRLDLLARYQLGGARKWWSLGASYSIR